MYVPAKIIHVTMYWTEPKVCTEHFLVIDKTTGYSTLLPEGLLVEVAAGAPPSVNSLPGLFLKSFRTLCLE